MLERTILLATLLPSLAACHRTMAVGETVPATLAPAPREAYVSDLTGVAFGNAFARVTADGTPATDDRVSAGDQAIDAAASEDGDELRRSCGSQGAQSHAQATAAFQPSAVDGVRQFGFALSTTAYARGGMWRGQLVICRGSHNTVAQADARATGRIDLTYDADSGASDRLMLRVSGASIQDAHLEVRDGEGRLIPLSPVAGATSVTATLPAPGQYSVRASIASHVADARGGNAHAQQGMTFAVSVQSMRDALALGYAQGPTTTVTLPLPVFLSADAISAALDSVVFTDQHRLYPCAKLGCGSDRLRDVYLEAPHVSTMGSAVVLEMRLAGSYQFALVFGGGVSGTIRVTAVPVVAHDTLRFEAPSVDVATHNLIVKWRAAAFERQLLERIRHVSIDLTPQLQAAVAMAQEQLAGGWGGACLLVAPTEAHVQSVHVVTTAPQGIVANFGIALSQSSTSACPTRRGNR